MVMSASLSAAVRAAECAVAGRIYSRFEVPTDVSGMIGDVRVSRSAVFAVRPYLFAAVLGA